MIEACVEAGIPRNDDVNGEEQEGVGYYQLTVKNGQRCSAAVAYLHPAMERPNLRVETDALATRVLFEGKRAVGRRVSSRAASRSRRKAVGRGDPGRRRGQLAAAPAALRRRPGGRCLQEHGIDVVADLPGVGENLQDHYVITTTFRLKPGTVSVNELTKGDALPRRDAEVRLPAQGPADPLGGAHRGLLQVAAGARRPGHPVPHPAGHDGHREADGRAEDGAGGRAGPHHRALPGAAREPRLRSASSRRTRPSIRRSGPTTSPIRSTSRWRSPRCTGRARSPPSRRWRSGSITSCCRGRTPRRDEDAAGLRPHGRLDHLSPGRHLPDGPRAAGGRRSAAARAAASRACASSTPR